MVRTRYGRTDWFQIGKEVRQGCILSPYLFNLYVEYIMRKSRLDEAQAGVKIVGRNINNLRYIEDTTLMEESKKELDMEQQTGFSMGMTQRDVVGREVGGGFMFGNACKN